MIAQQKTFQDMKIELDGGTFVGCEFQRCEIVVNGLLPFHLVEPKFLDCTWRFAGAALSTVDFMSAMNRAGATSLIESTCANILGRAVKAAPVAAAAAPAAPAAPAETKAAAPADKKSAAPETPRKKLSVSAKPGKSPKH